MDQVQLNIMAIHGRLNNLLADQEKLKLWGNGTENRQRNNNIIVCYLDLTFC